MSIVKTTHNLFVEALITAHGWKDQDPTRGVKEWATREIGGGYKGGVINSLGIRRITAKCADDKAMIAQHGDRALLTVAYDSKLPFEKNVAVFDALVSSFANLVEQ